MFPNFKRFEIIIYVEMFKLFGFIALVFLLMACCAKEEGKEIEDVFIVSTPSN